MRNPRLVCIYALIFLSLSVLSFAVTDLSRGMLGVNSDFSVASKVYATGGGHGHGHGHGYPYGYWYKRWWEAFFRPKIGMYQGQTHEVPEPSALVLFGMGMAGVYAYRRRTKR